jgi:protein TonB
MFEDSLLESGGKMKKTNPWAAFFSVAIQLLVVIILVLIPLIYTEALPRQTLSAMLVAPPPPPPPPPPPAAVQQVQVKKLPSQILNGELLAPRKIPQKIAKIVEEDTPPPSAGIGVVGGVSTSSGGALGGVIGGLVTSSQPTGNVQKAAPKVVRVSAGVVAGFIERRVQPQYPALARQARITGDVVLSAVIGKDGTIEHLQVLSGHPLLQKAALDAVREWKYKPYLLNGEAVEVDTQIIVKFSLSGGE